MVDCMLGALAKMLPDKVCAASDGGNSGVSIGGYDKNRNPYIYVDFACGTWGGRPWADGLQGNSNMFANMASQSVEVIEAEQPIEILAYELLPDRAGAGKFRGGAPYCREYRFTEREAVLQVRTDRAKFRPYGLYGGHPGQGSANYLNPDQENIKLTSKPTMTIKTGDVFRHELAGGGGWGDPLDRDPTLVLKDVLDELVSIDAARAQYGVVINMHHREVEASATNTLRAELRSQRSWSDPPVVSWDDSGTINALDTEDKTP